MSKQITKKDKNKAFIITMLVLLVIISMMIGIKYIPEVMQFIFSIGCLIAVLSIVGIVTYHMLLHGSDIDKD